MKQLFVGLIILVLFLGLISCVNGRGKPLQPVAANGTLDLRDWNFRETGSIALRGEWDFYRSAFIPPSAFSGDEKPVNCYTMVLPRQWNGFEIDGKPISGFGFATFHLRILLSGGEKASFAFNLPGWETAYVLYLNGKELTRAGSPGTSKDESKPAWYPHVARFYSDEKALDLVLHVSNFYHYKGGLGVKALFGLEHQIRAYREKDAAVSFILAGALFIIALYHTVIYLYRKKDRSVLYFGLFTFLMCLRMLVIGNFHLLTLFPGIQWNLLVRLTYLTFSLGMPLSVLYLDSLFSAELNKRIGGFFMFIGILYSLFILVFPPAFFTRFLFPFQIILLAACLYVFFVLALAVGRKREEAISFLVVYILFFFCILNDILYNLTLIQTAFVVPFGFVIFTFLQAVFLSRKYNRAFIKAEELFIEKTKLEGATLTLKNLSYLDSLTGIPNRRRFDEYLEQEWRRARRAGTSLSVIMIDIDFFKQFNDSYGHGAGDEALLQVAKALENSLNRPADLIARYGGEEFSAILPNTNLHGVMVIAEIMRRNVLGLGIRHCESKAGEILSISLGCSYMVPGETNKREDLVNKADIALYRAKQLGRNRAEAET